jgi:C1A family cysteine protease
VEAHNYQFYHNNGTYLTQVNMISLADLTGDQNLLRFGLRLGGRARARSNYHLQNARASIPETVDWRNTFVRASHFQSTCGACWAFATTGVTESFAYRKHNIRQEFSVQQLIDCTPSTRVNIPPAMRNQGCRGMLFFFVFNLI